MHTNAPGNTAIGSSTLMFNVDGRRNTAIGAGCCSMNVSGSNNTVVGYQAMYGATGGNDNTVLGYASQRAQGIVSKITAVGMGTLTENYTSDLVAIGYHALHCNQTGEANVAVGTEALCNTSQWWV